MLVDLVQTTTGDGVKLDGALQTPFPAQASELKVDAVCMVHGTGSNFYGSALFDAIGQRFLELGVAALRVNTRGHDLMSTASTPRGGRRFGAAYEIVDDCRHDLAAWVEWLRGQSFERIGLIGHSLGAVKCLYTLANTPKLPVKCVAALSPPRLSYSWFCSNPKGQQFLEKYRQAEQLVEVNQPLALMEIEVPFPFVIAAAGYLDKYGPHERYNYLQFIRSVPCPVLFTFASTELVDNMAFKGAPEELQAIAPKCKDLRVAIVEGADHFYSANRAEMTGVAEKWLRGMGSKQSK